MEGVGQGFWQTVATVGQAVLKQEELLMIKRLSVESPFCLVG
jgi:hypothetical protein